MEKVNVVRISSSAETVNLTQLTLSDGSFQEKVVLCERDESWLSRPVFPQDTALAHLSFLTYKDNLHETFFSSDLEKKLLAFSKYQNDLYKKFSSNKTLDQLTINSYEQHLKESLNGIRKQWQLLTTAQNQSDGYFGAAFWNSMEQQLVFSHRGTNPTNFDALLADIEGIMRNRHTSQIDSACTFVEHVLRELSHKKRFTQIQISITGHSLGAWLAQVTAFSTEYLTIDHETNRFRVKGEDDLAYHAHIVGFDSPGCRRMLTKLCEMFHRRYENPDHNFWTNLDITLYLTRPNMVNTCCKHVGKLYQIDIPPFVRNNWLKKIACYISYNLHYHSMENIVMTMSINNSVKTIQDWPLVIYPEKLKNDESKPSTYLDYAFVKLFKSLPSLIYDSIAKSNYEVNAFWEHSNHDNSYSPEPDKNIEFGIRLCYKVRDVANAVCSLNTFSKVEQLFLFCWPSETKLRVDLKDEIKKHLPNFVLDKHDSLFKNFLYIENERQQIECLNFNVEELINFTKQLFRFIDEPRNFVQNLVRVTQMNVSICKKFSDSYLQQIIVKNLVFKDTIGFEAFLNVNEFGKPMWIKTGFKLEIQRIYSILKSYKADYIFLDLMQLTHLNNYLYFLETIKSLTDYVLVLDCQQNDLNNKDLNLIKGLLTDSIKLKIIMVDQCDLAESIFKDVSKNNVQFFERDSQFNFSDLSPESIEWLRNKIQNKIMLQGKKINVLELIGRSEALDCDIVVELIKNDEIINIGREPMKLWQSEASYAKRLKFIAVDHLINALKDDSNELKNEIFVFTSSTDLNIDILFQLLKIEDEICKQKIIDCTSTFDCENENIGYQNFKKINILKAGKEIDFKRFCSYNSKNQVYWLEIINSHFYLHQIYDKDFYIQRHLFYCSRVNINRKAVNDLSQEPPNFLSDRFVLREADPQDPLINNPSRRISFFYDKETYKSWCAETPETPVHSLYDTRDELIWTQCRYYIKNHQDYVVSVDTKKMNERALANLNDKVVIIVAEPGMGKSTTLTHLSEFKVDDSWVIRLDLKDHQEQILHLPQCHDYNDTVRVNESIVMFLMNVSHINCALTEILLKYSLSHSTTHSMLILFDGYDEIDKVHQDKLIPLMRYLKVNTLANVWVTSRKHCTIDLEDQLCVFSTTFKELTLDERVNFLKSFWQVRLRLELSENEYNSAFGENVESNKFKIFSTALLEKVDKVLDEKMSKFMGIPLQMRLLAENFLPDFEAFIKGCSEYQIPQFDELNVTQIYQRFLNIKFTIYFEEKSRLSVGLNEVLTKWFSDDLVKRHQYMAFQLLFPDNINLLLELESSILEKDLVIDEDEEIGLKRIGLIHSNQYTGQLEFIHRTFAEYFVATLLLNWLRKPMCNKTFEAIDRLLKHILISSGVICSFLNEQILEVDVSRVKNGCFSGIIVNYFFQGGEYNHANLIKFILSFFINKIWLLNQCYFDNFFKAVFSSNNNLEITKYLLTLTIIHYDIFYKILFKPSFHSYVHKYKIRNNASALVSVCNAYAKENGKMLINAIKSRTKLMEEFVKCFYLDDLLELFADDEELCQLMTRLQQDEINSSEMCLVQHKINQLFNSIRDRVGSNIGGSDEIRRLTSLVTGTFENNTGGVKIFKNYILNFFLLIDARKPREVIDDYHFFNNQLKDSMLLAIIAERVEKDNSFGNERLREELALEKEYDKQLRKFLELTKFESIDIENQLKNEKEICQHLQFFINNEDLPQLVALLERVISNQENDLEMQSDNNDDVDNDDVDNDVVDNDDVDEYDNDDVDDDEVPTIFSCFEDYRNHLQSDLQKELNAEFKIKFIFQVKNNSNIISIFPSSFSNRLETFLKGIECEETKQLLSDFLPISAIIDFILKDIRIKTLFIILEIQIENENVKTWKDVVHIAQQYSNIAQIEEDDIDNCRAVDFQILKTAFQLLAINKEIDFYKAVEAMDNLLLKQMLSICSQHYPGILFLFVFKIFQPKDSMDLHYFQNKYSLILEFFWKTFPDVARCLAMSKYVMNEYTHLEYAVAHNRPNDLSLLFRILKPYPRILEQLLLGPVSDNDRCCLHGAIVSGKLTMLRHFLEELNRNTEVMRYVIEYFIYDEEDTFDLFEEAEVNNPGALLIFLNNLKIDDLLIDFLLPSDEDENVKSAFYLAVERGCKEVMDTLLSALKSEPDTLWELLTWTEANTGQTVLHRACERGYVEIADALLNSVRERPEQLKTLFLIQDTSQHTALDCAILSERQYIRKNFNKDLIENIHYKIFRDIFGDESCIESPIESLEKISGNLINVPMVINLILIFAKCFNNVELMLAIFENADLNSVLESMFITLNTYSYHLFECAIQRNSLKLVEKLIKEGIDMNYTDGYGVTPLMRAVQENRLKIVEFLIESGVDVYARAMHGLTAIALANDDERNFDMIRLFSKFK